MILLSAAPVREKSHTDLRRRTEFLCGKGITPSLKVFLVGNHGPSLIYTRNKKKFIESFGAECEIIHLEESIGESEFMQKLQEVTSDQATHGCFVQLPLPSHLRHIPVERLIPEHKDVDGFHPGNLYQIFKGDIRKHTLIPCTPKGIIKLLEHYHIDLEGKNAVVIGRSMIVGKPMAMLLTHYNATVTLCHSKTKDLKKHTKNADIIVSAVGKENYLDADYLGKNKPVIVDVGIVKGRDGKVTGDVDFNGVKNLVNAITPVPGGVGPMTINSLAENLLQAAENSIN